MALVLLVDDDEDLRDALRNFLEDAGHVVVTAGDGVAALAELDRMPLPHVAVIDFFMPVMDGLELSKTMRADRRLASVPVIIISAFSTIRHPMGTTALSKTGLRHSLLGEIERVRRV